MLAPKLMQLRGFFILFTLVSLALLPSALAQAPTATFSASRDPKWLNLLHYKKSGSGYESDAISPRFFVSPSGKADPEAELIALLAEMKRSPGELRTDENPICKFPARVRWLSGQFGIPIPQSRCAMFERFKNSLSARGVSLVFSSYFVNNPSSAFGHTFLRLRRAKSLQDSDASDLLDYGINYAAIDTSNNAVIYALAGAMGWFRGTFTKLPFYYKVREYSDFESRDLWFYNLNLSQEQIDELVRHIWELGQTEFHYYFFSGNCSYQIVAALDAVEPKWKLLDQLRFFVIPAETVKAVWKTPGLVSSVDYRPSNRRRFEARAISLSDAESSEFEKLIEQRTPNALSPGASLESRRNVLDAVIDYYDFNYAKDLLKGGSVRGEEKQGFLVARSELGTTSPPLAVDPPRQQEPHLGHEPSRIGIQAGYGTDLKSFTELDYRPAFNDLLDPSEGYPDYTEIQILDLGLRAYNSPFQVKLEKANLVNNSSLMPMHRYSHPFSWRFLAGMDRLKEKVCPDCTAGELLLAGGATFEPKHDLLYTYFLINTQGNWATSFPQGKLRLGIGPTLGVRLQPIRKLAVVSEATELYFVSFNPNTIFEARTDLRYSPSASDSFGAYYALSDLETELGAAYYFYF